jgi:hypothetical protein
MVRLRTRVDPSALRYVIKAAAGPGRDAVGTAVATACCGDPGIAAAGTVGCLAGGGATADLVSNGHVRV